MLQQQQNQLLMLHIQHLILIFLVVARHGDAASTSEAFLNITKPEYGIISVGGGVINTGNWPNQAALDRLQSKKCNSISYRN